MESLWGGLVYLAFELLLLSLLQSNDTFSENAAWFRVRCSGRLLVENAITLAPRVNSSGASKDGVVCRRQTMEVVQKPLFVEVGEYVACLAAAVVSCQPPGHCWEN